MQKGFSVIEIIVALTVAMIVSTIGIASLASYGKRQAVNVAALDVATELRVAKARSSSQVKPCAANMVLDGYQVYIESETQYVLAALCNNRATEVVIKTKQLPNGLKFQQTNLTFYFPVITGGVEVSGGSSIVVYSDTNGPKGTITVSTSGDISVTLQ